MAKAKDIILRFDDKYIPEPMSGCWIWIGAVGGYPGNQYGKLFHNGRNRSAHHISYELFKGPIPSGLTLDHLCKNTFCVNYHHLEAVTMRENILRGNGVAAIAARQKECVRGHPFTADNFYIDHRGKKVCRQCMYIRNHQR